ncbi:heme ABC exporter ATP-binding protein CcmA [Phenylobacterium sp.]|uniref:heme ABC exporter ATP-binding protein CcmA n=1 Tax=Phenylobacterium sp. TaxID=1871053 RepID=UPI00273738A1|nr:heme ABC exporter ATP-binding protein CcmA [Phenylobacterium sp.]MDP3852185.1 heme ABC exporter ATP-binding protein CcmA [Phenylobacterium sp.]
MIARLEIDNLALRRGGRRLFQGLTLTLEAGEAAALTGPNGAGKTSLLRAIAGLVASEAGTIGFGDLDPDLARRDHIHLAGHQDGQKPARTVREELAFWTLWTGGTSASAKAAAHTLELAPLLELEVRRLSAGQRRRLALARLLAAPRGLWLLDEPLSPLDAEWRLRFGAMMAAHLAAGGMIVAAVHDPLPIPARALEIGA